MHPVLLARHDLVHLRERILEATHDRLWRRRRFRLALLLFAVILRLRLWHLLLVLLFQQCLLLLYRLVEPLLGLGSLPPIEESRILARVEVVRILLI